MTLIELLVVISILLLIALIAVPAVRPGLEGQRIREAARMVNVVLGNARNRAEESGRPYGVEIERIAGQPLASIVLHQIEVPPPYGGDTTGAVVKVQNATAAGGPVTLAVKIQLTTWSSGLVRPGDQIQLNYQGPVYSLVSPCGFPVDANGFFDFNSVTVDSDFFSVEVLTAASETVARDAIEAAALVPWPQGGWSLPVPFAVFRQPVRTSVAPVQLPRGTAIDLTYSGTASTLFLPARNTDRSPVRILLSPNGAVDRLYSVRSGTCRLTEPVYLLVGKRIRVPTELDASGNPVLDEYGKPVIPAEDGLTNLEDLTNFWIAIQAQTGLVTTDEVADSQAIPLTRLADKLYASRVYAQGRPVGGR